MTMQALSFERRLANWQYDPWLTAAVSFLILLGTIMVYSVTIAMQGDGLNTNTAHLIKHLVFVGVGASCLWFASRVPVEAWFQMDRVLIVLCIGLMLAVFVPGIGQHINGSNRWIGVAGLTFQPSELMKVVFVIYFAGYLARQGETVRSIEKGIVVPGIVLGVVGLILSQAPDIGTLAVLSVTAGIMLFLSGMRLSHFLACCIAAAMAFAVMVVSLPHAWRRIMMFLDPWADRLGDGYQLAQALIAVGRGGWFGVGLGSSVQKLSYLPHANNDFMLAIVAEELGAICVTAVIFVYAVILWRAFAIARTAVVARNIFAARLAQGVGVMLTLQAMISIGVNTGALPTKGITLPFLGTGGSSMIASCLAIGILLGCERSVRPKLRRRK